MAGEGGGRGSTGSFSVSSCLTRSGITTAPRNILLSSSLSGVTSQECNPSTNLEGKQCDNLILIKIWCHDNEGHNDGLSFKSEHISGTTAEEQNLPVSHSKMLILWGPPAFEDEDMKISHHITENCSICTAIARLCASGNNLLLLYVCGLIVCVGLYSKSSV